MAFSTSKLHCAGCATTWLRLAGTEFAATVGCSDASPTRAVACLRALPAAELVGDESTSGFSPILVRGTRSLPADPRSAIHRGQFAHVPVLIGSTLDEGRAFTTGDIGWTRSDYENWVESAFSSRASAVLAQYPWPPDADQFTAAYLAGAILTDAGIIGPSTPTIEAGIGGCGTQALINDLARHSQIYAYEWAPRAAPGIVQIPRYASGAAHAAELAYLWPNFEENDVRISSRFNTAEQRLSDQIVRYWAAFVTNGAPHARDLPPWPPYTTSSPIELALNTNDRSRPLNTHTISAEHHCSFWNELAAS